MSRTLSDRLLTAPALMTVEHAAAHVGLSAPTFLREISTGSMPAARILGGKNVWLREELDAYARALPRQGEGGGDDDNPLAEALRQRAGAA